MRFVSPAAKVRIAKERLENNGIQCKLAKSYIDDIRFLLALIEKGMKWDPTNKKIVFCHDQFAQEEDKSNTQKTEEVLLAMMNTIHNDLKFTTETGRDYSDNWLPTLDSNLKIVVDKDTRQLRYNFYKKPMASQFTVIKTSALSNQ